MQKESIRMYAYAVDFKTVKVYLSKKYYDGVSSKFFIKTRHDNKMTLLAGETAGEENGYNVYILHTDIELGKSYTIVDAYGLTCFVDYSPIALTKEFDDKYYYEWDDLGSSYHKRHTEFKVWSPLSTEVTLKLYDPIRYVPMERLDKGVYFTSVKENLDGCRYKYVITMNEDSHETVDPYAYASTSNMMESIVINLKKIKNEKFNLPVYKHKTEAVIYELSVRDFSSDPYGHFLYPGKFKAFNETGLTTSNGYSTGIDYLKELGITHVQLMPINDFATVDETHTVELYNWGYDPSQYNVTEGSYVTDPDDGYKRIIECKEMIDSFHAQGIRVILDVVYNHMHDVNKNALEGTVPYYWFRRDGEELSNGSWCGNDLNTEGKMVHKYILNMCKRWQTLYGCDGFRMDLMGIIDIDTVNAIEKQGKEIDSSFMLYGEGWDMGTLPPERKAKMDNHAALPDVGFFNDRFRDIVRGTNAIESKGYVSGDTYKTNDAINVLCDYHKFTSIEQSINYIECHDNMTVFDKLKASNRDESEIVISKRCVLGLVMTIFAQGVPFLHVGEEFFGTKHGNLNSYNAGDRINALNWQRRDRHYNTVKLISSLIDLRKKNKCFQMYDFDDIRNHTHLYNINHRMIEYYLSQDEGEFKEFKIFINPSDIPIDVDIEDGYKVLFNLDNEVISHHHLRVNEISFVIVGR